MSESRGKNLSPGEQYFKHQDIKYRYHWCQSWIINHLQLVNYMTRPVKIQFLPVAKMLCCNPLTRPQVKIVMQKAKAVAKNYSIKTITERLLLWTTMTKNCFATIMKAVFF